MPQAFVHLANDEFSFCCLVKNDADTLPLSGLAYADDMEIVGTWISSY